MSALEVVFPPIIVGAWQLSEGHHRQAMDRSQALDTLDALFDMGVTTFDCADIYTGVEALLGQWLSRLSARRGTEQAGLVRVHTKLVPDRSALATIDRRYVERIVDRSLERLGVERLDLVQFAWWDYGVAGYVDVALWLTELMERGKVAAVGVTNFDAERLAELIQAGVPVAAHQVQYSALDHRPAGAMTDMCLTAGIPMLCYGTLAGGLLTDRWRTGADPVPAGVSVSDAQLDSRSLTKYRLIVEGFGGWAALQDLLGIMREVADVHGATVAQVAIAYALSQKGVASAIVGLSSVDRMRECVGAVALQLCDEELRAISARAAAAPGPQGPVFGLERDVGSEHARIMRYDLNVLGR